MIDLDAIRERDRISAEFWFRAPNNATARAIQDRRALLAEVDRLRAALLRECCRCGPSDPDPAAHAEWCAYRQWVQGPPQSQGHDAAQQK